ncbi:cadherin-related family member 5 [Alosa pseudoharengus]|uniref:cadherin-related family member 5 n=1 Tax=Alosa pseudoharengus TaxID=34774 RepID=UPI003F8B9D2A
MEVKVQLCGAVAINDDKPLGLKGDDFACLILSGCCGRRSCGRICSPDVWFSIGSSFHTSLLSRRGSPSVMDRPGLRSSAPLLLLLAFLSQGLGQICQVPSDLLLPENTAVEHVIVTVTTQGVVNLTLANDFNGTFRMDGNNVVLNKPLDYETPPISYSVKIQCTKDLDIMETSIIVIVENVNDNPPVFKQNPYTLVVDELLPLFTDVGQIAATDPDNLGTLYYTIIPDPTKDYFELQAPSLPNILVKQRLDFDTVQRVQFTLIVQDTQTSTPQTLSATTTVIIKIRDIDNRPPWFQPCTQETNNQATVCLNAGYKGQVTLTQQTTGPLPLTPENLRAVDGDKDLNAHISYKLLGVSDIFDLNQNTGEITMNKPVDVEGPIILTVMAFQTGNADQFSTTTVTFEVKIMSVHPPTFEKDTYEGYISLDAGVNSLVLEGEFSTKPLRVQATDQDYADGFNPDVQYEIQGSSDFSITQQGFILMARTAPAGPVSIQVRAVDSKSGDEAVTAVQLVVSPGFSAELPLQLQSIYFTTPLNRDAYHHSYALYDYRHANHHSRHANYHYRHANYHYRYANYHSRHANHHYRHAKHQHCYAILFNGPALVAGTYRMEDMVAVGVSLGILLLICVVLIALMAVYINSHKKDSRKIKEVSHFHSNLSAVSLGPKGGVQYTNQGFQKDEDGAGSMASDEPDWPARAVEAPVSKAAAVPLYDVKGETSSLASKSESEKEVKPILTKERKDEDGYKAVWFKQDIDPKVEVTIIPDRAAQDDDEDEDEDEDDVSEREGDNLSLDEDDRSMRRGDNLSLDQDENSDLDDYPQTSDL